MNNKASLPANPISKTNVDSVDAQALHIECERRIEALKTEAVLSEVNVAT